MRRLFAYITLAASVAVGIGVTANSVLTKVSSDNDFSDGKTITYRLSDKEDSEHILDAEKDDAASKKVAKIMSDRLESWGVTSYTVNAIGNDTVEATFKAKDDSEYDDISKYLRFSGQNYSISSQDDTINHVGDEMFEGSKARIEYVGYAPIVVIPVSDGSTLADEVNEAVNKLDSESADKGVSLYIWSNREEGDTYELANENPYVGDKLLMAVNSNNLWHDEETHKELQYICGKADDNGYYDTESAAQGYYTAKMLVNLFNAEALDYNVRELYRADAAASVENLVHLGEHSLSIAPGKVAIASAIAIVMISLILIFFYRSASVSIICSSVSSTYLTLVAFILFGVEFNVAALVGIALVAVLNLVGGIHYANKLKEEIYRGRSIKKANSEASKKNTMVVADLSIVSLVAGVLFYLMGGSLVSSMGVMLILGSVANVVINVILLKLMMYFVTNSTKLVKKYKAFGVEEKLVANGLETGEKKELYQGPYQAKDFTKKHKLVAGIGGGFTLIGVVMAIVFGVLNGSSYNTSASSSKSRIYIEVNDQNSLIEDTNYVRNEILDKVYVKSSKGEFVKLSNYVADVSHEEGSFYNEDTKLYDDKDFFIVNLNTYFSNDSTVENAYTVDASETKVFEGNIQDCLFDLIISNGIDTTADVTVKTEHSVVSQMVGWNAIWATLITIGIAAIYLAIRFRLSRGIASFIITCGSAFSTLALFIVSRIVCSEIVTLAGIAIALISIALCEIFFTKEKEMRKDALSRKQSLSLEERHEIMVKATAISASSTILIALLVAYLALNFFGFGPTAYSIMFSGVLLGVVIAALYVTSLLGKTSYVFEKLFSMIKIKPRDGRKSAKRRAEKEKKNRSAEPEESPVIGINI